jgi:general secretion pathway protein E
MNDVSPTYPAPSGPDTFASDLRQRLLDRQKIPAYALEQAFVLHRSEREDLASLLLRLNLIAERDLAELLAEMTGAPVVTSADFPALPLCEEELPGRFLKESRALPIAQTDAGLVVALAAPHDAYARGAIALKCGRPVLARTGLPSEIGAAIDRMYGGARSALTEIVEGLDIAASDDDDIKHLRDLASEAPVVRLVNLIINQAVEARASDIHIEPFERLLKIRYRVDGVLQEVEAPPAHSTAAVISRLKLIARMNIAERRLPQDGRIQLRVQGRNIDMRVSTVPTLFGESVVLRILDRDSAILEFGALGFDAAHEALLRDALAASYGIVLVTGPTGSGKTTTLYAALQTLNAPTRKILTVEDPVEYQFDGVNQIQVKPQIGLGFANALRALMRQDPDVIMIGEMRDGETARIAVQSALTGHLVLSTLHTNDAGSSITRLLDMGIEDYLVTSTVRGVLAQRLVRRLCADCRECYEPVPELLSRIRARIAAEPVRAELYRPVGCGSCSGNGYRGRLAIMEFMPMTDAVRRLVLNRADGATIERSALAAGMSSMLADGYRKALAGLTSIEEVLRVSQEHA